MITPKTVYAIEGLDRLGKSTLISGIKQRLGFYQVIHFSKPEVLNFYAKALYRPDIKPGSPPLYHYQAESFRSSMLIAKSGARVIFDRWHLGEAVYSNLYRGYDGNYVFDIEERAEIEEADVRLILLTEDMAMGSHFLDDGLSFDNSKREEEQAMFIEAFHKSRIKDKRIICVSDQALGGFKPKSWVLNEALA